jgi:bifunctional N-acetylglucosamine-1-phosphate-uridyltransferase/glucosamine-1-phosphate-acetyltransferase GlmU-like protein
MLLLLSISAFALMLLIPAIPALFEIFRPKDDVQLHISELYERNPRWFGTALRAMLAPFVAAAHGVAFSEEVKLRTNEEVVWAPDMVIEAEKRVRGISVGDRVRVGQGAGIRDAYALETLDVESGVVARTLTSDGVMRIGESVQILRWIDANGEVTVGADSNLGVSASCGSRFTMANQVEFERVWGSPVATRTAAVEPFAFDKKENKKHQKLIRIGQAQVEPGKPMILYGAVRIERDTHIPSHIKVHGPLDVEPGVRIDGNVIVRGDVTLAADVDVSGHVFAEGTVRLGPRSRVGRSGGVKTVYAGGHVLIANDVEIQGWLVADAGGNTL